eukprot:3347274-Amphidinium_carterae.1
MACNRMSTSPHHDANLHDIIPAAAAGTSTARFGAATPTSLLQNGAVYVGHSGTMPTTFQRAWALSRERRECTDVVSACVRALGYTFKSAAVASTFVLAPPQVCLAQALRTLCIPSSALVHGTPWNNECDLEGPRFVYGQ